jgi:glycosyltransferase involved in cell wall biosynthesis
MADIPYFTVFTPSFNSRETLPRVYESLRAQTYDKFEWLVVNDGSTDGTEALVEKWQGRAAFPIRYFSQENRGKHRSFNRAVTEAKGALFICLDADDECVPDALEKCRGFWESIPKQDRNDFSGVTVHCTDASGKIVGKAFPKHCMDLTPGEMNVRHPIRGEKWGIYRTDILGRFPFPEIEGEKFIPEGLVWNRIGRLYKMRYVDEALRVYHYSPGGLTAKGRRLRIKSPAGARLYYKESLSIPSAYQVWSKNMKNYIAFSLHAGIPVGRTCKETGFFFASIFRFPAGYALYLLDRILSAPRTGES